MPPTRTKHDEPAVDSPVVPTPLWNCLIFSPILGTAQKRPTDRTDRNALSINLPNASSLPVPCGLGGNQLLEWLPLWGPFWTGFSSDKGQRRWRGVRLRLSSSRIIELLTLVSCCFWWLLSGVCNNSRVRRLWVVSFNTRWQVGIRLGSRGTFHHGGHFLWSVFN